MRLDRSDVANAMPSRGLPMIHIFHRSCPFANVCHLSRPTTRQHEALPSAPVDHHDIEPRSFPPHHCDEWRVLAGEAGEFITAVWVCVWEVVVILVVGDCNVVDGVLPYFGL